MGFCSYSKELGFTTHSGGGSGGGDSDIMVTGTDGSRLSGDNFTLVSANDSNVVIKMEKRGKKKVISFGVYYL